MSLLDRILRQQPKSPEPDDQRMVSLTKTAAVSLTKNGLNGQRAAVYLVLDHSGSMNSHYRFGAVQHLAEQALGLAANLDDNGTVPVVFFDDKAHGPKNITIGQHHGAIEKHRPSRMGSTDYTQAIAQVVKHYQRSGSTAPALVLFQTDGEPNSEYTARRIIQDAAKLPMFWQFIGFGPDGPLDFSFLRSLDTMVNRVVDNAGFFAVGDRPMDMPDGVLYDAVTGPFSKWLSEARQAGVL